MKSGSHHPQTHTGDDWVDGSWTVDCVCGVNFDDGEEMVNCDDCGVWVHTRCSGYVKGDELFTCDKCKSKSNRFQNNNRSNYNSCNINVNDSEETEVAQLLVELPTKTIRLENNCNNLGNHGGLGFRRLWTDRPMEDRVHVQGIPAGDPDLFKGLSSIFGPQLWKCTGYVPKKFNFRYREFPCWDDDEEKKDEPRNEVENENNVVDSGAGVLFALSKDSVALVDQRVYSKGGGREGRRTQIGVKMERGLLPPFVIHTGKRKEDSGLFNDRSGKKKARSLETELEVKKRGSHVSKTAFTSTSDAKQLEFYEDRHTRNYFRSDTQSKKNKSMRDSVTREKEANGNVIGNGVESCKNDKTTGHFSEAPSTGVEKNEKMASLGIPAAIEKNEETGVTKECNPMTICGDKEGNGMGNGNMIDIVEEFTGTDVNPSIDSVADAAQVVRNNLSGRDDMAFNSLPPKLDMDNIDSGWNLNCQSSLSDGKAAEKANDNVAEKSKMTDARVVSSPDSEHMPPEVDRTLDATFDCRAVKADIPTVGVKEDWDGSKPLVATQKCPELNLGSVLPEGGAISDSPTSATQSKTVLSTGKSSSAPSTVTMDRSSVRETGSPDNLNANADAKQRALPECTSRMKKDRAGSESVKDAERNEVSRKMIKEQPKSFVDSTLQSSNSSKISQTYASKKTTSDAKDLPSYLSSKPYFAQKSPENSDPQQHDASHAQNKAQTSGLSSRCEKFNQSSGHSSSKSLINPHLPTSSPAALSDEELALLLHQELNSSPRVPRVPRVRQAGSLPQLTSPTATSMLMKRSSSSGGKDFYGLVSRRKTKDPSKDGSRRSHNLDNGAQKTERTTCSPDQRRRDTGFSSDGIFRREHNGSFAALNSIKKNVPLPPTSTSTANSCPSSSTEVNDHLSSVRNSPKNISDEEAGTVAVPVHRTLPGLINEIMSKGRRMTYEELFNSVLPHWHNLRKHNGERYAYSSHSQAVLDCLRNRQEWARLVDRGPKTNMSKKKRRPEAEESEDNDYSKGRTTESKSLESREEFPKGRRNTRKRRLLALQGREIKDIRKSRKAGMLSDDEESDRFSPSSDEILFSDDEIQGNGAGSAGNEGSASSDEMGNM